jgi:hypothetical protein
LASLPVSKLMSLPPISTVVEARRPVAIPMSYSSTLLLVESGGLGERAGLGNALAEASTLRFESLGRGR